MSNAALQSRVALGPRAGRRIRRIGTDPDAPWITSTGPRQAHHQGFDLHANVAVGPSERKKLENLCRYILRPPISQERLRLTSQGQVLLQLRSPWVDGTTHFLFEPLELLEKLAALIPRPRINLIIYHGILAPHARDRAQACAYGRPAPIAAIPDEPDGTLIADHDKDESAPAQPAVARRAWADLMRRAFDFDVLACPRCGGHMHLIATIEDPAVVRRILTHLGLSTEIPEPLPARSPPDSDRLPFDLTY